MEATPDNLPKFNPDECWFIDEKKECTITKTPCTPSEFCVQGVKIKEFMNKLTYPSIKQ